MFEKEKGNQNKNSIQPNPPSCPATLAKWPRPPPPPSFPPARPLFSVLSALHDLRSAQPLAPARSGRATRAPSLSDKPAHVSVSPRARTSRSPVAASRWRADPTCQTYLPDAPALNDPGISGRESRRDPYPGRGREIYGAPPLNPHDPPVPLPSSSAPPPTLAHRHSAPPH